MRLNECERLEKRAMKWLSVVTLRVSILIVIGCFAAAAQQLETAQNNPTRGGPTAMAGRQRLLQTTLHQRVVAAGGKLDEVRDAQVDDLAGDLPSLMTRSNEILLVHLLTTYGGVSPSGNSVLTHYEAQILQSWKGAHRAGDVVTVWVPAGGLVFPDGTQASRRVRGLSGLRSGGRYVLFLRSSSKSNNSQNIPGFWLVGDGVQGAFLLDEEKVRAAYTQGALWEAYNQSDVSGFLDKLGGLSAGQR